jgi:hypothetical protein
MKTSIAEKIYNFYAHIHPPNNLPKGIEILFPQGNKEVLKVVKAFLLKYYSDNKPRKLILGINPGRFGAGITGINFTAPKQLTEFCQIEHPFGNKSELSAEFIYEMIAAYGGPGKFYGDYFLTSVCPLGFTKNGINLNYYDDKQLMASIKDFIVEKIQAQLSFGFEADRCVCIGGEKNFKYLNALNKEYNFFNEIISVPHPRFIMQYKRKMKQKYIEEYLTALA